MLSVLLQCRTLAYDLGGHHSMHQTSSPQRCSNTSSPLWIRTGKPFCEWLDWPTSTLGTKIRNVNFTHGREKLTWSCMCEYPFDPRGKSYLCLIDPNIFSPSKWDVYEETRTNLALTTICNGSPDQLALHNRNPSLLVGAYDLRPLWSPPVSLNLVRVLVFFRNF